MQEAAKADPNLAKLLKEASISDNYGEQYATYLASLSFFLSSHKGIRLMEATRRQVQEHTCTDSMHVEEGKRSVVAWARNPTE